MVIEKSETEIATIGSTRQPAAIQADIDAKLTSRADLDGCEGKWLPSSKARAVCIDVAALKAEKATADRKADLEDQVAEARAILTAVQSGRTVGNGDTAAIVGAFSKLGFKVEADTVDLVKALGTALGVELFAAALFMAGVPASVHPTPTRTPDLNTPAVKCSIAPPVEAAETPDFLALATAADSVQGVQSPPPKLTVADDAGERLVQMLSERGGQLFGGQRTLAKAVGVSVGTMNTLLRELADAGTINVKAGKGGTVVQLAA